jgi:hypothetical protein
LRANHRRLPEFSGIEGFVILDTVGNGEELKRTLESFDLGIKVLETRQVGLENIRLLVLEAIDKSKK